MRLWKNIYTAAHLALDVKHSCAFHSIQTSSHLYLSYSLWEETFYFFIIHAYRRGMDVKHWLTTTETSVQAGSVGLPVLYGSPAGTPCCQVKGAAADCMEEAYGGLHSLLA